MHKLKGGGKPRVIIGQDKECLYKRPKINKGKRRKNVQRYICFTFSSLFHL